MSSDKGKTLNNTKDTKNEYVDDEKLTAEVIKWQDECNERGYRIPLNDYIGRCILALAKGLSKRGNFYGYSYRDEMIDYAIENVVRYIHKFKREHKLDKKGRPKKLSAYSYINMMLTNAFIQVLNEEEKHAYYKDVAIIDSIGSHSDPDSMGSVYDDAMNRKLEYEEKCRVKKLKREEKRKMKAKLKKDEMKKSEDDSLWWEEF